MRAAELPFLEVVLNADYGGFSLSQQAIDRFNELATDVRIVTVWPDEWDTMPEGAIWASDVPRHHPALVQVVRELGDLAHASGPGRWGPRFQIERITLGYSIEDHDGKETLSMY